MCVQVVTPGYVRVVKGEGMPKSKQPGQKGDLRIVFDVQVCPCLLDLTDPVTEAQRYTVCEHLCRAYRSMALWELQGQASTYRLGCIATHV